MGIGKTPQNQLDALPLQDADSAAAGGEIQIVGGSIVRYFSASVLGLNGVVASTFVSGAFSMSGFVTPYLNCVGCAKYMILVRAATSIARGALPAMFIAAQQRFGIADAPAVVYANGAGLQQAANGYVFMSSTNITLPATSGTENQAALFCWDPTLPGNNGPDLFTVFGSDIRFFINFSSAAAPAGTNTFSVQIWAQT